MKVTIETVVRPAGAPNSFNVDAEGGDVLHVIHDGSHKITIRYEPGEAQAIACMSIYVAQHEMMTAHQKQTTKLTSLIVPGGRG